MVRIGDELLGEGLGFGCGRDSTLGADVYNFWVWVLRGREDGVIVLLLQCYGLVRNIRRNRDSDGPQGLPEFFV